MAKASEITEEVTVHYAAHEFEPLEMLDFIQLDGFKRSWRRLGLTDLDLKALRTMIATAPGIAPVIQGTGGLRKFRFKDPKSNRGKSGGYRVCYAYFESHGIALLVQIYPKSRKDDLSASERRNIKEQLEQFGHLLERKPLS
jgi:hypothetical protein